MPILAKWSRAAAAWLSAALVAFFAPACAAQPLEVRVGVGFGLAFLPTYLMDELKLVEKHARAAGLDVTTTYRRFSGSGPMQDAILSGNIDMGPLGIPTLLIASEKARGTPLQPFAIAGVTTLPLVLLSNRIGVAKLADLTTDDRVAMPSPVSPQMYLLQMAAEQAFGPGQHDRFRHQVVSLPHPDAVSALASGSKEVTAYFSSPPFTALAMKTSSVHRVLDSDDVFAGKSSFVVMEATRGFIEANPKLPDVVVKAVEEAADIIARDPLKASTIYLQREPSKRFDAEAIAAILKHYKDDFGSAVRGVETYAKFMTRLGQLKIPPASWKDVAAASIHATKSD